MSEIKDGGPAFPLYVPTQQSGDNSEVSAGMTLRDYLAANLRIGTDEEFSVAYAEAIVGRKMPSYKDDAIGNAVFWSSFRAKMRYIEADAMLVERDAHKSTS